MCLYERWPERSTSTVPEIHMSSWVVFAQALQDLLVVDEAVQRPQNKDIEGDVADLLQLKVPAETLQPAGRPARLLQLQQKIWLLMQVCCQGLWTKLEYGTHKWALIHYCNSWYLRVWHKAASHLQALKVLQQDISDALVVSFYVSIGASFPTKTDKHQEVFISKTLWSHCRQWINWLNCTKALKAHWLFRWASSLQKKKPFQWSWTGLVKLCERDPPAGVSLEHDFTHTGCRSNGLPLPDSLRIFIPLVQHFSSHFRETYPEYKTHPSWSVTDCFLIMATMTKVHLCYVIWICKAKTETHVVLDNLHTHLNVVLISRVAYYTICLQLMEVNSDDFTHHCLHVCMSACVCVCVCVRVCVR